MSAGSAAANTGLGFMTAGPVGAAAGLALGTIAPWAGGSIMRRVADSRTLRAADEVAADIRRTAPLSQARAALPENMPVEDLRSLRRNAIAGAVLQQMNPYLARQWGEYQDAKR
jgi:hypothetical protein